MDNEYLIELLRLIKEANDIEDQSIKLDRIHHIRAYGAYLYYIGAISNNDFTNSIKCLKNDIDDELYYVERDNLIEVLLENNMVLNEFFRKKLLIYWHYKIVDKDNIINIDIEKEFNKFLKYVNCYKIYENMKKESRIASDSNILKHSICIDDRESSYIILKNKNAFQKYLDLSHEIAHVYENKILSKYQRNFDSPYNIEILSITFNRMFIEFLYQNGKISNDDYHILLNNFETNYFNFLRLSMFISESICSGYYSINDYDISIFCEEDVVNRSLTDYNYAIGRIAAFKLYDDWKKSDITFIKNIPNLIDDIYHMDIKEIINNFGNNDLIIEKELSKCFIKK